ncbi:hypothetical protein [Paracandidimonas soli]|uniref:hypothetical protein n=1 Tax=Paracandidimonas soli TaxID=1917182 RepID=UPI00104BC3FD|nr:hypothetical protein [Paracandidimonas soli]
MLVHEILHPLEIGARRMPVNGAMLFQVCAQRFDIHWIFVKANTHWNSPIQNPRSPRAAASANQNLMRETLQRL